MLTFQGIVQNGVIVIGGGTVLPEGTRVSVELVQPTPIDAHGEASETGKACEPLEEETIWQKLNRVAEKHANRPTNLPSDLAENHDHYLHGTPKRT